MLKDLILTNRSYRRFDETKKIKMRDLRELVDLARLSASGANLQSLRYYLSNEQQLNNEINECIKWAGYLEDWNPAEGERATAFIVMLQSKERKSSSAHDQGIAAQSILLGAVDRGLGGCMLGAVNRERLRGVLEIDDEYDIMLVIALGYPKETVVIEEVRDGNIKYWRTEDGVHHVPKRSLDELIINN